MSYKGPPTFLQSMYSLKNVNGKLLPGPSTSVTENFIKNKINNLKSNFDQASQRKIKNLTLYGKIIYLFIIIFFFNYVTSLRPLLISFTVLI